MITMMISEIKNVTLVGSCLIISYPNWPSLHSARIFACRITDGVAFISSLAMSFIRVAVSKMRDRRSYPVFAVHRIFHVFPYDSGRCDLTCCRSPQSVYRLGKRTSNAFLQTYRISLKAAGLRFECFVVNSKILLWIKQRKLYTLICVLLLHSVNETDVTSMWHL
jgi:hypothetical protein